MVVLDQFFLDYDISRSLQIPGSSSVSLEDPKQTQLLFLSVFSKEKESRSCDIYIV